MQNAETVLNVIRERGERGLPLENIYRLLYNRNLYLRAYGRIYSNQGATTKGITAETMDGMSLAKIDRIIEALRYERFRWTPVRRVNIPKPNGKTRALGIPTGPDKLLQEVIRMILEAYYEPQFSDRSHGFRPDRGCHTALSNVTTHWTGVRWFVEGDIKGCFDNIDHDVLLSVLGEKLHDNRFLRLLKYLLKAGYVEDWKYGRTLSGTPQGGIVSPLLANIYLDRLDKFVENVLIPAHTRGTERERQPRVHTVAEPSGPPEETGEPRQGTATAQANATTAVTRPLRPRLPPVTVRTLRGRLRAGLHRDKGRSPTGKRVLGDVPARLAQAGAIQGENSHNPRHQPGGAVPRLRAREPTGQRPVRPQRSAQGSTAKSDCGFPPTSSNNIAKPTCAKANRHTAVTYSTMKITESWHSTSRSTGASSTTTFWPTTSLTWGDCEGSWRCHWHGPLRQSTSPPHGRCDASTRASWKPSTGRAFVLRSSSNGTTASHLAWHISVAYP